MTALVLAIPEIRMGPKKFKTGSTFLSGTSYMINLYTKFEISTCMFTHIEDIQTVHATQNRSCWRRSWPLTKPTFVVIVMMTMMIFVYY